MINYGSAQVNGLPFAVSAITPGTRQLLHVAPPGDATPHRITVYGAMLDGHVATYLKIVVETADGEILRTTCKYLKGNTFQPCSDSYLQLNGGCRISVYAEGADACMVTAQVDDQAGVAGTAIQAIYSGRVAAVQNAARYATGVQGGAGQATEAAANIQITRAGVLRNLRAVASAAVGSAASVDITVRKNGTATALTANFSAADSTAAKTVSDSVPVAAGDLICFEVKETADAAPAASFQASVEYLAYVQKVTAIPLGIATGAPTVGSPALRSVTALTPLGIATGAPTVGRPVLRGVTDLTPLGIATGAPTVGAPILRGVTALTPLGIATGAPTVGSPVLEDVPATARYAQLSGSLGQTANIQWAPGATNNTISFTARWRTDQESPSNAGRINLWDMLEAVGYASVMLWLEWDGMDGEFYLCFVMEQLGNYISMRYRLDIVSNYPGDWVDCSFSITRPGNSVEVTGMTLVSSDSSGSVSWPGDPGWGSYFFSGTGVPPNFDMRDLKVIIDADLLAWYKFDETSGTTAVNSAPESLYHQPDMTDLNVSWTPT